MNLPDLDKMTIVEAIHWYTGEVAKVFTPKARINGTYSDDYKNALFFWKQCLNEKIDKHRRILK
ncbi:hypothetical protein GLV94_02010 [Virgibacillus halodenitrificans]|uniref:hypothetical protein n=1 Tax=Virgibacillus halodenitrificans TaxID=1482 RepID=UPI001367CDDE|nr:hypothetical protein [Virgibacillus halodenitrificans]MYL44409.1 hypothetical protein [Virgibacillus halodenitrificans]